MKKIAYIFVGILMMLGGVTLTACDKKVSLSVSTQSVELTSNYEVSDKDYQVSEVEVNVKNSDLGIVVECVSGQCVTLENTYTTKRKANNKYAFNIRTAEDKSSGDAIVKVSSLEDSSQFELISVKVYTGVESFSDLNKNLPNGDSNNFVVKGVDKNLAFEDFFTFEPVTANIVDVEWSLESEVSGAKIENGVLSVSDEYALGSVTVVATYTENSQITKSVELAVLNNSTIKSFVIGTENGDKTLIGAGVEGESVSVSLKRNDTGRSKLTGALTVDSNCEVEFLPIIQMRSGKEKVSISVTNQKYFTYTVESATTDSSSEKVYTFAVDAYNNERANRLFGDFEFYLDVHYKGYNYDITTQDKSLILIETCYVAERVDLLNEKNENINNQTIDIFSNSAYQNGHGYCIGYSITPTDVSLDSYSCYIQRNNKDVGDETVKFWCNNKFLTFDENGKSEEITVGSKVYVSVGSASASLSGIEFEFVSVSSPNSARTKIYFNLYEVDIDEESLNVSIIDDEGNAVELEDATTYISSSKNSTRTKDFKLKIDGITAIAGLSLVSSGNSNFEYSPISLLKSQDNDEGKFIVVGLTVSLDAINFEGVSTFGFYHVVGKSSNSFNIESFIPLQTASVKNADGSASNVLSSYCEQGFVKGDGEIEIDGSNSANSIAKIMIEAGTTALVSFDTQKATLDKENQYTISYLTELGDRDSVTSALKTSNSGVATNDDALKVQLSAIFDYAVFSGMNSDTFIRSCLKYSDDEIAKCYIGEGENKSLVSLADISTLYNYLLDSEQTRFVMNDEKIVVSNAEFRDLIAVTFNGYDENHESKSLIRFFVLESFYDVEQFSSNVKSEVLYTSETLSSADADKAFVSVKITTRTDRSVPTYLTKEDISFESNLEELNENLENSYYTIAGIDIVGGYITFGVTAKSTNGQMSPVCDVLMVKYSTTQNMGVNRQVKFEKVAQISFEIKNMDRVEKVSWNNQTSDDKIYLNLKSLNAKDKQFVVSMSVSPSNAYSTDLVSKFITLSGASSILNIDSRNGGKILTLSISGTANDDGGYGYLFVLPKDMLKINGGTEKILVYKKAVDSNGQTVEVADYLDWQTFANDYSKIVNGEGDYLNYFRNDAQEKVLNSSVIKRIIVTIADGKSRETAIQVTNQDELESIVTTYTYKIVNDITLDGWKSYNEFSGEIFADETRTLKFTNGSQAFVNNLKGTIDNITFVGEVSSTNSQFSGFVANNVCETGVIENCVIDVYYENGNSSDYKSSKLSCESADTDIYVGAFAGNNAGEILNCYAYGVSIDVTSSSNAYVGGIVGATNIEGTEESLHNSKIANCGFEFYKFSNASNNKITVKVGDEKTSYFGGIIGYDISGVGAINNSYIYSFASENDPDSEKIISCGNVCAFVGYSSVGGITFKECFAYLGNVSQVVITGINEEGKSYVVNLYNCYVTEKTVNNDVETVTMNAYIGKNATSEKVTTITGDTKINVDGGVKVDASVWEIDAENSSSFDKNVNFGLLHLKNTQQMKRVDVEDLTIYDVSLGEKYSQVLSVENSENESLGGVLLLYKTTTSLADATEKTQLERFNTISIKNMLNLTDKEAKSVVLTTGSSNVSLTADSIKLLSRNVSEFDIVVHSKTDFSKTKTFKFVVVYSLPELSTRVDGVEFDDGVSLYVQTGVNNIKTVHYGTTNSISLGDGSSSYILSKENYNVSCELSDNTYDEENEYVTASEEGSRLLLQANKAHGEKSSSKVKSYVYVDLNDDKIMGETTTVQTGTGTKVETTFIQFVEKSIGQAITRIFNVVSYDGAKSLVLENANSLVVKASQYASFVAVMTTDSEDDNLVVGLKYGDVELAPTGSETSKSFVVDNDLTLDVSWTKTSVSSGVYRFNVLVKVAENSKHKITHDYDDLTLIVNAKSQSQNTSMLKTVDLSVQVQNIEDTTILTYGITNRYLRDSVLYYNTENKVVSTFSPASEGIVSVVLDPVYANLTHFTLTYEATGESVGIVNFTRLVNDSRFGFYYDQKNSSALSDGSGIRVDLTDTDKQGDGVFYFRMYVSSTFASKSSVKLTLSCYNGKELAWSGSYNFAVDFKGEATVLVNGDTTCILAKGDSATVTITVDADQSLDNMYLVNNKSNIFLTTPTYEIVGTQKIYTATLTALVDATLVGESIDESVSSGIFYVCASVKNVVAGIEEIKTTQATVCLVDFSVDADNISLTTKSGTATYNGKNYDRYYVYIGETSSLSFDYPLVPEEYNYVYTNTSQKEAVDELNKNRQSFALNGYYKDDKVGYYINYDVDSMTGSAKELTLVDRLWYATSESSAVAVDRNGEIVSNNYFTLKQSENSLDSTPYTELQVTGKRAGTQLMKLETVVVSQGVKFVYEYYFVIVVEVWTDEDTPTQIATAEDFVAMASGETAGDYMLVNDIVLQNYTPISTDNINSFDGNGYVIYLDSFASQSGEILNLALFDSVAENTTLKNVTVNIYNGGQIAIDVSQYSTANIAGFALSNEGIIYNCQVVSFYDGLQNNSSQFSDGTENGLVVTYTKGKSDSVILTTQMDKEYSIAGFVMTNSSSITNCRVGGDSLKYIDNIAGTDYVNSIDLGTFTISGQGNIAGFVYQNDGSVSASFVKDVQITNKMEYNASQTAGFVLTNNGDIQTSYVEGVKGTQTSEEVIVHNNVTNIKSAGIVAGFVYENANLVKNSYANIAIEKTENKAFMVAGFVYQNDDTGTVTLCYSACEIDSSDIGEMQFSGIDGSENSLNNGTISNSYFYHESRVDDTIQSKMASGATALHDVDDMDSFYGFSFASDDGDYNGIWKMTTNGIALVSANEIAISNRCVVAGDDETYKVFYNRNIRDAKTLSYVDLTYGSDSNPIIIRSAEDFAKAMGNAGTTEISSYKSYYSDTEVFGNYRLVHDIDLSEIQQNAESSSTLKLTTMSKTFSGIFDGNGFAIQNISLAGSSSDEDFGLFARLSDAVIMGVDLTVDSVHNSQAMIVGVLAGTATDSRIISVSLAPTENSETGNVFVQGNNIVGGVVGIFMGESVMSDIHIENMQVFSVYYSSKTKTAVDSNKMRTLSSSLDSGASLKDVAGTISYAGAVAGYVDVYSSGSENYIKFSSNIEMSDCSILSVRVSDSIEVYAEVAGGIFGYVGKNTLVYDATLTLDADMALSNQSHIISKNLYAGGLVGENYGGLFAVSASYEESLQEVIESNEHAFYNGSTSVEKGQQSIFSYTTNDTGYAENINNPLFIGGLVGYMGGGYINIGYNKLNVISHGSNTVAVGGIVGVVGYTSNDYKLSITTDECYVGVTLYGVYSSGDVEILSNDGVSDRVASGIVGAMEIIADEKGVGSNATKLCIKDAMALNYLTNLKDSEGNLTNVTNGVSSTHALLIGTLYAVDKKDSSIRYSNENRSLSSSIYLLNTLNDIVIDLKVGGEFNGDESGSKTVGGYTKYTINKTDVNINICGFGSGNYNYRTTQSDCVLEAQFIGDSSMSTMSYAFSRMYKYFLMNGWEEKYWVHDTGSLFPEINLTPRNDVIYWDAYTESTDDVFKCIQEGKKVTIVVRGLTSDDDNCNTVKDIDLSTYNYNGVKFSELTFKGKLLGYNEYMGIQKNAYSFQINKEGTGGQSSSSPVGIILNGSSLFNSLEGATIQGVPIYMNVNISRSVIADRAITSIIRKVDVVYGGDVTMNGVTSGGASSAGLFVPDALSTSFETVNFLWKVSSNDSGATTVTMNVGTGNEQMAYAGLIAGQIHETNSYTNVVISDINFGVYNNSEAKLKLNVVISAKLKTDDSKLYAGLYAGLISQEEYNVPIGLEIPQIENVTIKASSNKNDCIGGNACIGGVAGKAVISSASYSAKADETADAKGMTIVVGGCANAYAGLIFGELGNATMELKSQYTGAKIVGKILSEGNSVTNADIGGIVGKTNSATVSVNGILIDLIVGNTTNSVVTETLEEFDKNQENYDLDKYSFESTNLYVGGVVGESVGGTISFSGNLQIDGGVFAKTTANEKTTANAYAGGMIGTAQDTRIGISANVVNNLNIYAKATTTTTTTTTAHIGGVVGNAQGVGFTCNGSALCEYNGITIVDSSEIVFGGAVGNGVNLSSDTGLSNIYYGGALKVFGEALNGGQLTVGGVIGQVGSSNGFTISKCYAYGDVMIMYGQNSADRLSQYIFGGIVGNVNISSGNENNASQTININGCYSLLTNFNDRVSTTQSSNDVTATTNDHIGAIVGQNADKVSCSENYYNSSVCMAYQYENENFDVGYVSGGFDGYSTKKTENILAKFSSISGVSGAKINPYQGYSSYKTAVNAKTVGNSHGITWINLNETEWTNNIDNNLKDVMFVGNGQTVKVKGNDTDKDFYTNKHFIGGFVNELGTADENKIEAHFSGISGVVFDLDIAVDVKYDGSIVNFGGIVGKTSGHTFIYGVGVEGKLSVGGKEAGQYVRLAGMIGDMEDGFVNECYVDADIIFRAGPDKVDNNKNSYQSVVSGIANVWNGQTTIKATYSSGKILRYVDAPVATFVYSGKSIGNTKNDIEDCYSITQIEDINALGSGNCSSEKKFVVGNSVNILGSVIDASQDTTAISIVKKYDGNDFAVGYDNEKIVSIKGFGIKKDTTSYATENNWYYSKHTNYGYASHGFGYLKNVTTYRFVKTTDEKGETTETFEKFAYSDLVNEDGTYKEISDAYYEILSASKLNQIISYAKNVSNPQISTTLRYDIKGDNLTWNQTVSLNLDGQNHTISFTEIKSSALFNVLTGNISNLRISGLNVSGASGILAETIEGDLTNLTVTGSLTTTKTLAGGIAKTLQGNASYIEAVVNVTATQGGIVGGLFGEVNGSDEGKIGVIDHVTNNGRVILTDSSSTRTGLSIKVTKLNSDAPMTFVTKDNNVVTASINAIAGGIVGQMDDGAISNSYNSNSILANYSGAGKTKNSISGGIVGYMIGGSIKSCDNAGLVGSGMTSSTGYNYAGGIVGYAQSGTVSSCTNGGAVQALGAKSGSYKITVATSGTAKIEIATTEPDDLEYTITMTYNSGSNRLVNAYGIGYSESADVIDSSNTSSDNNILNQGNVGEISVTSTLTFARKAELAQQNGGDYEAKFVSSVHAETFTSGDKESIKGKIGCTISAYDSYGFPLRLYATDTMTRSLTTTNPLYKDLTAVLGINEGSTNLYGKYTLNDKGEYSESTKFHSIGGTTGTAYISDGLKQDLTYPSSSILGSINYKAWLGNDAKENEYNGYDSILSYLNKMSAGNGTKFVTASGYKENDLNDKLQEIDDAINNEINDDDGFEHFTINGTTASIAKNRDGVLISLYPYTYTAEFKFDGEVSRDKLSFGVSSGDLFNVVMINEITATANGDKTTSIVSATFYYTEKQTTTPTFTCTMNDVISGSGTAYKNNLTYDENNGYLHLDLSEESVTLTKNDTITSVVLGGTTIYNSTNNKICTCDSHDKCVKIEYSNIIENLKNNDSWTINISTSSTKNEQKDVYVGNGISSGEVISLSSTENFIFKTIGDSFTLTAQNYAEKKVSLSEDSITISELIEKVSKGTSKYVFTNGSDITVDRLTLKAGAFKLLAEIENGTWNVTTEGGQYVEDGAYDQTVYAVEKTANEGKESEYTYYQLAVTAGSETDTTYKVSESVYNAIQNNSLTITSLDNKTTWKVVGTANSLTGTIVNGNFVVNFFTYDASTSTLSGALSGLDKFYYPNEVSVTGDNYTEERTTTYNKIICVEPELMYNSGSTWKSVDKLTRISSNEVMTDSGLGSGEYEFKYAYKYYIINGNSDNGYLIEVSDKSGGNKQVYIRGGSISADKTCITTISPNDTTSTYAGGNISVTTTTMQYVDESGKAIDKDNLSGSSGLFTNDRGSVTIQVTEKDGSITTSYTYDNSGFYGATGGNNIITDGSVVTVNKDGTITTTLSATVDGNNLKLNGDIGTNYNKKVYAVEKTANEGTETYTYYQLEVTGSGEAYNVTENFYNLIASGTEFVGAKDENGNIDGYAAKATNSYLLDASNYKAIAVGVNAFAILDKSCIVDQVNSNYSQLKTSLWTSEKLTIQKVFNGKITCGNTNDYATLEKSIEKSIGKKVSNVTKVEVSIGGTTTSYETTDKVEMTATSSKGNEFSYKVYTSTTQSYSGTAGDSESANSVGILILGHDIAMRDTKIDSIPSSIVGQGFAMNFVTSTNSGSVLGKGTTGSGSFIKDTIVVAQVNDSDTATFTNYSMLTTTNDTSTLTNISFYGTMRNIHGGHGTIYTIGEIGESETTSSISSYVTMVGLSTTGGITTTLKANTTPTTADILIAGSSIKGKNGTQGTNNGEDGGNGDDGYAGGNVDGDTLISHEGYDSIPGYGGDGANGTFSGVAKGGGAGGHAGKAVTSGSYISSFTNQYGGNGGAGSVGIVDSDNDKFYSSANGGTAGSNSDAEQTASRGSDGGSSAYSETKNEANNNKKFTKYCAAIANGATIANFTQWNTTLDKVWWSARHDVYSRYHVDDNECGYTTEINNNITGTPSSLANCGLVSGNNGTGNSVKVSTFYVYSASTMSASKNALYAKYTAKHYGTVAWTSGETLNGAGEAGYAIQAS